MWKVYLSSSAKRQLKSIPASDRVRIWGALSDLEYDPYAGDTRPLRGDPSVWRLRVGGYRIFYEPVRPVRFIQIHYVTRKGSHTYKKR